jgi:GNAT superfamily N-acetyltransferase
MFIKHRVTDVKIIRDWCRNIDYGRNLPMVGLLGGKIVGVATLHQQLGGWKRHIGRVSVLVHPEFRGRGLARTLISEMAGHRPARGTGKARGGIHRRAGRRRFTCLRCSASASFCGWKIM